MKKAQIITSLFITYGLSIIAVAIAIVILNQLGIIPGRFLPGICVLKIGLSCKDFKIDTNEIAISVMNGGGKKFDEFSITIGGEIDIDPCAGETLEASDGLGLDIGETKTFKKSTTCAADILNKRFKADLLIDYKLHDGFSHSKIGYITTVVEGIKEVIEVFGCDEIKQITTTGTVEPWARPAIYGNIIVWEDGRNGFPNPEIFMYNLKDNEEFQITEGKEDEQIMLPYKSPAIYGDKIVWADTSDKDIDIYMYDIPINILR